MYIVNFVLCLSSVFILYASINKTFKNLECHDQITTKLFTHSLKKTLDKQILYKRLHFNRNCSVLVLDSIKGQKAYGLRRRQTLNLKFNGKVSND